MSRVPTPLPLLLARCACVGLAGPQPVRQVARPGYQCALGRAFEDIAWASWSLDAAGRPFQANIDWRSPQADIRQPRLSVIWSAGEAIPLRLESGFVSISLVHFVPRGERPPLARLELTTDPDGRSWTSAPFAGNYERSGHHHLFSNFPDSLAFARGAPALTVVLRDQQGRIVARAPLDPAHFARAEADVRALMERMREVSADFRNRCEAVDDIDPEIVVT